MAAKASCQVTIADITDAYSVVLTSETYTFMGNTSGAPVGSACTTQAIAYQGDTQCSKIMIGTISCPNGISASVANDGTASPTITFKTTAMISAACEASIPVIVDGVTIYKKFSFAVANQGAGFGWNIAKNTGELPIGTGTWESGTWRSSGTGTIKNVTLPDSPLNNLTKGILITRTNTSDQIGFCQDKYTGLLKGEAYTVSAWVKCSEKMAVKLQTYWTGDDTGGISQSMTVEANKWTHLSFTSEPLSSTSRSIAYIYSKGGSVGSTMYVCGVKLEKGTKATEWTPHPDDLIGDTGKGIKSTAITYQASTSGTTVPTGTWSGSIPTVSAGQYLWTRTIFSYSDNTTSTIYGVSRMGTNGTNGTNGSNGKSIGSVVNYYLATASSSGVTSATSGWTTTVQSVSASKKYLWNYEVVKYSDGTTASTTAPCIIGTYGDTGAKGDKGDKGDTGGTGATGNGIKSIAEHYAVSTSNSSAPTSWSSTVPTMTESNKYLWNYETITYTNGTTSDTTKRVIGVYGNKGESDIKSYQLVGGSGQAVWSKLGTLTSAGNNSNFIIKLYSGNGYNGGSSQNSQAEIVIKDGWQSSASTTNAFGVSVTRQNCDTLKVQVRATASNECDVWVYLPWQYGAGTYTISGKYTTWSATQTTQTAEPTTGTLQDLAYRTNAENAAKTATNFMQFTDGTGLEVGNKTSGSWSGYRSRISSAAFEILNQAGTTLAHYGEKLIQLGKNATDAVIELCGGKGKIKYESLWIRGGTDPTLSITAQNMAVLADDKALIRMQHDSNGYRHTTQLYMKEQEACLEIFKGKSTDADNTDDYTAGILISPDKGICFDSCGSTNKTELETITVNLTTLSKLIYPVGSIYMSVNSTNPQYLFGGTWEAWGSGRVPIGVNASDSDFNAANKTGGSKTVNLEHKHEESVGTDDGSMYIVGNGGSYGSGVKTVKRMSWEGTISSGLARLNNTGTAGSKTQSIIQPYVTCYMWKRTA